MTPNLPVIKGPVEWLKEQCNRYVNGQCHTLRCMRRGGYNPGDPATYNSATCEAHEAVVALNSHAAMKEACDKIVAFHDQCFCGYPLCVNGKPIDHTLLNEAAELARNVIAQLPKENRHE